MSRAKNLVCVMCPLTSGKTMSLRLLLALPRPMSLVLAMPLARPLPLLLALPRPLPLVLAMGLPRPLYPLGLVLLLLPLLISRFLPTSNLLQHRFFYQRVLVHPCNPPPTHF